MYANYIDKDQGRRITALCTTVVSPADKVYAALAEPCYKITITENGDEPKPNCTHFNTSITIIVVRRCWFVPNAG